MILLYAFLALLLGAGVLLAGLRTRILERRYVRAAEAADKLAAQLNLRGGNCNLPDPLKTAKRQFELGRLVEFRDRIEEKYDVWEARAEACRRRRNSLLTRKGRFAPYAFGVVDMLGIFAVMAFTHLIDPDHLKIAVQSARMLVLK